MLNFLFHHQTFFLIAPNMLIDGNQTFEITNNNDNPNSLPFYELEIKKNTLEEKYQSLVIELENAQKKIENLENDKKNDRQKQNDFNQKTRTRSKKIIVK